MQEYTWFFSLKNELKLEQKEALEKDFATFTAQWQTHGTPVDGLVSIKYDRFIIAQASPTVARPSGCSIDSLKRGITQILQHHQLKTLDNGYVFYRNEEGQIDEVHFRELPQYVDGGRLTASTIVLDHSLSQTDDLGKWEMPLQATWLKRFLN
ncbi:MAG: hypothetical protein AAFY71_17380 [Bacteroidota bacterium]